MNKTHACGAGCCSSSNRRVPFLMFLGCLCFCLIAGGLLSPLTAHAASGKQSAKIPLAANLPKAGSSGKSTKKTSKAKATKVAKAPKRKAVYVRSLMPAEEREELLDRGISSGFGDRAVSRKRTRQHKGIDIPGPKNSKVVAYNDGEVIFAGVRNAYGKTVIVRQLDGREALYAHMNGYVVSVGDQVRRGSHIGFVGRTGRATGNHLHFEIIDEGEHLDPTLHIWHGSELVRGPDSLDPDAATLTQVAEPEKGRSGRRGATPFY